jgi:broad specificity phosphatase PhoE
LQENWNICLPLTLWDRFSVLLWKLNLISGDESIHEARQRTQDATRELIALARTFSSVLFVGHGMINSLIGRELRRQGWRGPRRVNDDYWGLASFQKDS